MNNSLPALLNYWFPQRDAHRWVLGTVYHTDGSAYRKPGAHMLFNDAGEQFGLLSGGCLESDLQRNAMRALMEGRTRTVRYDSSDEEEMVFKLGLGCGGVVDILLQPIEAASGYLGLQELREHLRSRCGACYWQRIPAGNHLEPAWKIEPAGSVGFHRTDAVLREQGGIRWLVNRVSPQPHLLVAGAGIDARPLIAMAAQLGWETTLLDPRPANARREYFPEATRISRDRPEKIAQASWYASLDAAIVMTHSKPLDAAFLRALANKSLRYCALLGPPHRRDEVLAEAGVTMQSPDFVLQGPAGLNIGGDLPESIALSILAQCHAALYNRDAAPLQQSWQLKYCSQTERLA
ncbi:MAG: XdhC family protein [Pseudomonadales bacterium]